MSNIQLKYSDLGVFKSDLAAVNAKLESARSSLKKSTDFGSSFAQAFWKFGNKDYIFGTVRNSIRAIEAETEENNRLSSYIDKIEDIYESAGKTQQCVTLSEDMLNKLKILAAVISLSNPAFCTYAVSLWAGGKLISKLRKPETSKNPEIKNPENSNILDIVGEEEYKKYRNIYDCVNGLNVNKEYKATLVNQLKNMDPDLKGLYNDHAKDLKCLDTNYSGTPNFNSGKGGFVFSETADANDPKGAGNTFFHESAHMLDYLSGKDGKYLSECNDLASAIEEDYINAISEKMEKNNCSTQEAQAKLIAELKKNDPKSHCVSDIFGGLSENKVTGFWGHPKSYWKAKGSSAVGREAFAEITADIATNAKSLEFTRKYMPKTYEIYQSIIKGARKNG